MAKASRQKQSKADWACGACRSLLSSFMRPGKRSRRRDKRLLPHETMAKPEPRDQVRQRIGSVRRQIAAWTILLAIVAVIIGPISSSRHVSAQQETGINGTGSPLVLDPSSIATDNSLVPLQPNSSTGLPIDPSKMLSREGLSSTLQIMILLTVLSLAPAILLMTTCFVRIVVVLGLLRQAIGTQQLPPSQVITTLSLFISLLIMAPVWQRVYNDAVVPYTESQITGDEAWQRGVQPIRRFMSMQIERAGNAADVWLFLEYMPDQPEPQTYDEVPLPALLPAFMLSELKTAFLIGFQIYLPFLILDMVIASVMVSMGMLMLPPVLISFPFKLLLFILVDGWHLIVGMLMESFQPFT